eukprot:m.1328888 g.1328888  ORF g.1328888 m.1328888 type:complete len:85 (+) comp24860_c0_seq4:1440-1694(+)
MVSLASPPRYQRVTVLQVIVCAFTLDRTADGSVLKRLMYRLRPACRRDSPLDTTPQRGSGRCRSRRTATGPNTADNRKPCMTTG